MRLQKFLSQAGVASRRHAEGLIKGGAVKVNGVIATLGQSVDADRDVVKVSGKTVTIATEHVYLALNKPVGFVTTRAHHKGEKTVFDLLPPDLRRTVWPIGRLDKDSCGLLLLTNDGELTQRLTHPRYEHEKEYLVRHSGMMNDAQRKKLQTGVALDDGKTAPCKITLVKQGECKIVLKEGKKRQIRRMLETIHCHTTFLQRIRHGKITLGNLAEGKHRWLPTIPS